VNRPEHQSPLLPRMIVGLIVVAIGVLLLVGNLGWIDAWSILHRLWPLALVAGGIAMLRDSRQRRGSTWPWVLITAGAWIFANNMQWIGLSFWDLLLPGILVVVGYRLIQCSAREESASKQESQANATADQANATDNSRMLGASASPEFVRSSAFMSYCDLHPVMHPFSGGDLTALMGGIKLDLRDVSMQGDRAFLDVFAFWGGIEILVPPDWTVSSQVTTLIGGFVDNRKPSRVVPTKTLIVRGLNLMSGIEVKN